MSKSVSPTGVTTTTVTSQSSSPSGATTTDTTTTTSSSTSSTSSTESSSSSNDEFSFTTILAEIAELTNQQSATLAQQQTSQIDAIGLQAADTMSQAANMMTGATSMMTMAVIGLGVSMGTMGVGIAGVGAASKEADEAEMQSMSKQNQAIMNSSEESMRSMDTAISNPQSRESATNAANSASKLQSLAKNENTPESITTSANEVAYNVEQVSKHAPYLKGGVNYDENKSPDENILAYKKSKAYTESREKDFKDAGQTINTPEEAIEFYKGRAEAANKTLQSNGKVYNEALKSGVRPGKSISDEQAKAAIQSGWSKEQSAKYNDPDTTQEEKEEMLDKPAAEYKNAISNLKSPPRSSEWHQNYQHSYGNTQLYAGAGTAIANVFNSAGQMQDQIYQAKGTEDSAAAQTESSTEQAMAQGTSQTNQIADQLRQSMNNIASYMAQDASQKM